TDGLIGFEAEIVGAIRDRLPRGCRVHTVGIGASVNRALTESAARAGAGVEVIVAPGESPHEAARRLVARTAAPLVVDLEVEGSALRQTAAQALPDLYAGAPAAIPLALDPAGGVLRVRGRTADGEWVRDLVVAPVAHGAGDVALI